MDPLESAMMMAAYVRRKQWEAERMAEGIWSVLGKAMGQGRTSRPPAGARGGMQKMSGMQLLNTIGVEG